MPRMMPRMMPRDYCKKNEKKIIRDLFIDINSKNHVKLY